VYREALRLRSDADTHASLRAMHRRRALARPLRVIHSFWFLKRSTRIDPLHPRATHDARVAHCFSPAVGEIEIPPVPLDITTYAGGTFATGKTSKFRFVLQLCPVSVFRPNWRIRTTGRTEGNSWPIFTSPT
jgi:hypothetical protein